MSASRASNLLRHAGGSQVGGEEGPETEVGDVRGIRPTPNRCLRQRLVPPADLQQRAGIHMRS